MSEVNTSIAIDSHCISQSTETILIIRGGKNPWLCTLASVCGAMKSSALSFPSGSPRIRSLLKVCHTNEAPLHRHSLCVQFSLRICTVYVGM